ncbi:GFA family protein [Porticoccus sp.]
MRIKGSCLCAEVRFEIDGDFESFYLCHCQYCRKDTGSAHASNLFSTTATLHWLAGQDSVKVYQLPSTRHMKSFCLNCGAALPNLQGQGELLVVPAGSLDDPVPIAPTAHIFVANRRDWDQILDKIPKWDGLPA